MNRIVPSIPTRRSSDLRPAAQTGAPGGDLAPWAGRAAGALAAVLMGLFLDGARHLFSKKTLQMTRNFILRSEEHTSELQSRFDLVCRLLLENKTSQTH